MARLRKEQLRTQMAKDIKNAARQEMAEHGTVGISLRGIARRLEITAPAVYNYFPSLDDLITALIVDAFIALADAMEKAGEAQAGPLFLPKARAAILAYRGWALDHPVEFQLIYGNPIPGYTAPEDVTTPLAARPFTLLFRYLASAFKNGEISIPLSYQALPGAIAAHLEAFAQIHPLAVPTSLYYFLIQGWSRVHGMVMLELFNHTRDVVGDTRAFYEYELDTLLASLKN